MVRRGPDLLAVDATPATSAPAPATAATAAPAAEASSGPPTRTIKGRGFALDVPSDFTDRPVTHQTELLRAREPTLVSASFLTVTLNAEYFTGKAQDFVAARKQAAGTVHEERALHIAGMPGVELVHDGETAKQRTLEHATADGVAAGYVLQCVVDTERFEVMRETCTRILQSFRFTQ